MNVTKINALLQFKKFEKMNIFEIFEPLIKHGPHWINFIIP